MKGLFKPASSLMSWLSYPQKIALISGLLLLPLVVVSLLLNNELSSKIHLTEKEQRGLEYIKTIRQLYQHLPQHRGMTNGYLHGALEYKEKILKKRQAIRSDITAIDAINGRYGSEFETNELWSSIKKDWQELEPRAFNSEARDVFSTHTALIDKLYRLIGKVSSGSGLVLDSNVNTSFVIDTIVYRIPLVTESLGQLRGLGTGVVAAGEVSLKQRVELGMLMGTLSSNYASVDESLMIAIKENKGWNTKFGSQLVSVKKQVSDFSSMLQAGVMETEFIVLEPDAVFTAGSNSIAKVYEVYDALFVGLEGLFESRLEELRGKRNMALTLIVVMLLAALYVLVGFYLVIVNTIQALDSSMNRVAAGDLTVKVHSGTKDELNNIAISLNKMIAHFHGLILQLGDHSSLLASASTELSATTEGSKGGALAQQQQAEQIASVMSEMVTGINDASANAKMASTDASEADREASEGGAVIRKTIVSIEQLAEEVNGAAIEVHKLEQNSIDIGSVLDVIRSIADQTNLLALNAAIEAARAGEHGRGFAVVADEVRTLAGRTQESTAQIQEMVERLQNNTKKSVMVMEANKQNAGKMAAEASNVTASIERIISKVAQIMDKTNQVASASESQAGVAKQVDSSLDEVSDTAHSSVVAAGEIAIASEELARLATELQDVVAQFKT